MQSQTFLSMCRARSLWAASVLFVLLAQASALAEVEWLRRIDRDRNGFIEPDEITDSARRYLERYTKPYGFQLTRPNSVEKLEEAIRLYHERLDDDDDRRQSDNVSPGTAGPMPFGKQDDETIIPGFGLVDIKYPYTADDLDTADGQLRRYDRDRDGFLDSREVERGSWNASDPGPFEFDFDGDRRLSRLELAQRYARRRVVAQRRGLSLGGPLDSSSRDNSASGEDRSGLYDRMRAGASRGGDRGTASLAASIVERYDFNRNEALDPTEMASVGISISSVDYDRNTLVDREELSRYLFEQLEAQGREQQEAIPTWFFERDTDGDQQVLMAEFATEWTPEMVAEFNSFDDNQDGIITMDEILTQQSVVGGEFSNRNAQVMLPRSTVVSEIEVSAEEDMIIGDLDVQLSISHTYTEQLDGYVIGPDGQRIELFTGVGGSDDHFDRTIFDDDDGDRITRGRPPFRGKYSPEAVERRQTSLNHYRGKHLQGVWQLMIRASRSERSGILHGWSLLVQPDREAVDNPEDVASLEVSQTAAKPSRP